ncbi:GNAT family N-acetyltransferase [Patescibacteria group bacterium]|nr:GNAT family N-acetyltransferase [Patescibacteria group bacterium]MBU1673988.1 GNAT family N-acetyltransferase [Patescibacteria group bacterium]MBU1962939.1 GNAT family N-acetyltransferase [Patescibacteria group bacterium]
MNKQEARRPTPEKQEIKKVEIGNLDEFDMDYFHQLEGEDGWIAIGQDNCQNQKYFTLGGTEGDKLGIIGVFDTDEDSNITHTVIDPKFRGQRLASRAKHELMDKLNLPFITMIIDLDNLPSIKATEKIPGVKRVSDDTYEEEFHKVKLVYEKPPTNT